MSASPTSSTISETSSSTSQETSAKQSKTSANKSSDKRGSCQSKRESLTSQVSASLDEESNRNHDASSITATSKLSKWKGLDWLKRSKRTKGSKDE
jgi:hypothetical protein